MGYDTDLALAQRLLVEAVRPVDGVLDDPEPAAWVTGFGTSSIDFVVLVWFPVATHNLWKVQSDAAMAVKEALDAAGIDIPFPQRTLSLEAGLGRALLPAPNGRGHGDAAAPDGPDAHGPAGSGGSSGQMTGTVTATAYVLPAGQGLTAGATPSAPSGASSASAPSGSTASTGNAVTAPAIVKAEP